jgi:hypothetical protein
MHLLFILPASFWVVILLLIGGSVAALRRLDDATSIPLLAVLATAAAWYVGDAFYNDYANNHVKMFTPETLSGAWWQVAWFLIVILLTVRPLHEKLNGGLTDRKSGVMQLFKHGVGFPEIQIQLNLLFTGCAIVWSTLFVIALIVLKTEIPYYLFPFLGYKANPWSHGRVGSGFDAFSIIAVYLQLLTTSMFGVVAALATTPRVRRLAFLFVLLSWPAFVFDRTRNTMLAMAVPAVLSWVFLRLRGGMWKKVLVLLACFLVVNTWMKFVIANRSKMSITAAFHDKGLNLSAQEKVHNEGLNMFEELCWVSTFIDNGRYKINWGQRYFAELVNPIPRGLWHGKPLIGLDYAIARGHGDANDTQGGVNTTISTGFIGQGVVNFGRVLGPAAAALLMSLWIVWLARLDLTVHQLGRLPLYSLGLILTFNLGRDITLITLYPFVFGAAAIWWLEHYQIIKTAPEAKPVSAAPSQKNPRPAAPSKILFSRRSAGGFVRRDNNFPRPKN